MREFVFDSLGMIGNSPLYIIRDEFGEPQETKMVITDLDPTPSHIQTLDRVLRANREKERLPGNAIYERRQRLENRTAAQKRAIAKRRKK